ncbi:plant tudor-like RNA-binding protein [Actinidia rufa]|uniref:Plant tudor-like RNA-binding protein n=1 Tax=Actinidia rufa TaxID=165716 RepID=A0A7J0FZH3_9ERIC|nr:plant tudor-like RNA-binding protein [Actinidia rufa]
MTSEALVERVPRKAIRPCPPLVEGMGNWVSGDHMELFQNMAWKTATVVKALDGNSFLVRLVGEYQEVRVHIAHLRVRQSWEDDKWVMIGKVKRNMGVQKPYISTSTWKRASSIGCTYLETHDSAVQKVRAIEKDGSPRRICAVRSSPLPEKEMSRLVDTDSCASSVGSCSVGLIPYRFPLCSMNSENEDTESFCSDTESFCGRGYEEEGSYLSRNEELVVQDHGLELCAYCSSAMKALYASGPLSWEDEMKVTDIRHH